MIQTFGLELRELPQGAKPFVLRSALPCALRRAAVDSEARDPSRAFAVLVLMLVNMNGDKMEAGGWAGGWGLGAGGWGLGAGGWGLGQPGGLGAGGRVGGWGLRGQGGRAGAAPAAAGAAGL
jgi:hypothetical protein